MDQPGPNVVGSELAKRHVDAAEPDPEATLVNYAERCRAGDWSMRSALTRYAQPHPARAAKVLTVVRRLDGVLHHVARALERHTVTCDRTLSFASVGERPGEPYPDSRVADLARLQREVPTEFGAVLDAYEAAAGEPLGDTERSALPLLAVALSLDGLAETLSGWANEGPRNPPVDEVDAVCAQVSARLDELGVPVEQGPPPGRRGPRSRDT